MISMNTDYAIAIVNLFDAKIKPKPRKKSYKLVNK